MKMLTQPKVLIIDEVGYLGLDHAGAAMLFQVLCNRYEKNGATIITSNKPFAEWAHIFAEDPVMASAALDRLLHRATILNIKGESYRLREKRKAGLFPSIHHQPEKTTKH
jgi:DNA replication protein DnaC